MKPNEPLGLGMYGWLQLVLHRSDVASSAININCHHGFTGGKLAGAKALDMQRWLWTHHADVVVMGHCHGANLQWEQVEHLDRAGKVTVHKRVGLFSGTFLQSVV